ncbi:MAG: hypothetical protein WCF16_08815 [Alphaproteobacteria bacterium]
MRALLPLLSVMGFLLAGCASPRVMAGDPNSAVVRANGLDVATELANEHCGRYGRIPRLLDARPDQAGMYLYRFECY